MDEFTVKFLKHVKNNHLQVFVYDGDYKNLPFIGMEVSKVAKTSIYHKGLARTCGNNYYELWHKNWEEYINKAIDHSLNYKDYYKFCFVRNTYDRIVSAYEFFRNRNSHKHHINSFEGFVDNYIVKVDALLAINKGHSKYRSAVHIQRQDKYVEFNSEEPFLDDIYSFENLYSDWDKLINKLGKPNLKLLRHRINRAKSGPDDYRKYYSDDVIEKVNSVYAREIELFNFKF